MASMGQALNNWLQHQNTSVLRQLSVEEYERKIQERPEFVTPPPTIPPPTPKPTICSRFPPNTREQMIAISIDSAHELKEMGASINDDYVLGKVITGTRERVPIPRPAGTMGTYHTHPFGWARPSIYDALDAISRNDKVMCIGATGKIGTKIKCFAPKEPKWSELRDELQELDKNIALFNKRISGKFKERGIRLRQLLRVVEPDSHEEGVMLEHKRQELLDKINRQLLNLGYKEEWRPQEKVNGWADMPLMMDSCHILWETIKGEPSYE
ncbi:hypothetical protein KKF82_07930 [Patescibacteria group bacterium]|uniref:Uncharacterized protein n=1 Tax=viral metagenome TaxID=1070528 RepID=A0A6M3MGV8_9ZZZZ|nr:hypothetical protein [Patescibacteria group bacterium]